MNSDHGRQIGQILLNIRVPDAIIHLADRFGGAMAIFHAIGSREARTPRPSFARPACLGMLALALSGPLSAQNHSSSESILSRNDKWADLEGAIEMRRLGGCLVRKYPGYSRSFIESLPGSDTEDRVAETIGKLLENCLTHMYSAIRFSPRSARGAVAEALYLERNQSMPNPARVPYKVQALPAAWFKTKLSPSETQEVVAQDFAQCVAAADPMAIDSLLRTVPRSPEEGAIIGRIRPLLGPCMIMGQTYHFDAGALRSYLGQALQRYDTSNPAVTAQNLSGAH